jgi:hypothetical protein
LVDKINKKLTCLVEDSLKEWISFKNCIFIFQGILDILALLIIFLLQSGHYEKGLAVCQALLDFNLFSPGFSSPGGQDIQEKVCY